MGVEVHYKVLEEDTFSNDIVGEGSCKIGDLCKNEEALTLEIQFEGAKAGTVTFSTTFINFADAKESERLRKEEEERIRLEEEAKAAAAAEEARL